VNANLFLIFGDVEKPKPPRRLYALLDQSDVTITERRRLLFDSVDADWFDHVGRDVFEQPRQPTAVREYYERAPVYVLQWDVKPSAPPATLQQLNLGLPHSQEDETWLAPIEREWIELSISPAFGPQPEAQLFYNLFAEPLPISIENSRRLSPYSDPVGALANSDPLAPIPDSTVPKIRRAIASTLGTRDIEHVGIYDIGQGSCAGLSSGGRTVIYADFGGGVLGNSHTFPPAMKSFCFCASRRPPVVLSHWDWDHWSSANRDTRALASTWIVPRQQPLGHVHGTFIAAVQAAGGQFLIWPQGGAVCSVGQITLDKCTGSRRNDSGLALTVAAPPTQTGDPVLLPGDATYSHLPSTIAAPFDSIACPHHGGAMRGAAAPACPGQPHSRLAYSYGSGNGYQHPLPLTRSTHDGAQWFDPAVKATNTPLVRETAHRSAARLGHIAVGWRIWNRPPPISCTATTCDLAIQQT